MVHVIIIIISLSITGLQDIILCGNCAAFLPSDETSCFWLGINLAALVAARPRSQNGHQEDPNVYHPELMPRRTHGPWLRC